MTEDPPDRFEGALGALLLPLRIPLRAASALTDIAGTLDRHAKQLLKAVEALQAPLEHIDEKLSILDESLGGRLDGVGADLATRVDRIEQQLTAMMPVLERMAGDLDETARVLPDPNDGPMSRLRDTFTSS